jgi:hypothetical protein
VAGDGPRYPVTGHRSWASQLARTASSVVLNIAEALDRVVAMLWRLTHGP